MNASRVHTRACILSALLLWSSAVQAHQRPLSYSIWKLGPDRIEVQVQLEASDLARLGFDRISEPRQAAAAGDFLAAQLSLSAAGELCRIVRAPQIIPASAPWYIWNYALSCPKDRYPRVIDASFVRSLDPAHRHLMRIDAADGGSADALLDASHTRYSIATAGQSTASSFASYVRLGVEHLWTGADHMLFLLGLLLLSRGLREVFILITTFTLAHSSTLALAALGAFQPDPPVVEALIGFSIALVGMENSWLLSRRTKALPAVLVASLVLGALFGFGQLRATTLLGLALFCACHFALLRNAREPSGLRALVAFAFGLVHGLGFSGALRELALKSTQLVPALFGFNLGVELGQLSLVVLAWPLLRLLQRARGGRFANRFSEIASAAVCGTGLYWFITRSFG
jgi:hypothetical protein